MAKKEWTLTENSEKERQNSSKRAAAKNEKTETERNTLIFFSDSFASGETIVLHIYIYIFSFLARLCTFFSFSTLLSTHFPRRNLLLDHIHDRYSDRHNLALIPKVSHFPSHVPDIFIFVILENLGKSSVPVWHGQLFPVMAIANADRSEPGCAFVSWRCLVA